MRLLRRSRRRALLLVLLLGGTGSAWAGLSTDPDPPPGAVAVGGVPKHVTGTYPPHCTLARAAAGQPLPDRTCTPGMVLPGVTLLQICTPGFSATIRPPSRETGRLRPVAARAYGVDPSSAFELDHVVPLELGGSNDVANLFPEPGAVPNEKDTVEGRLHREVCAGRVGLVEAQVAIAADWTTALQGEIR